ncbi:hypothetical protein [Clostridium scatologenes]|uniref:Uncharacterized protein n=1 Tax=Clostridium scatologenes TaxID=1548 RepID=A0A0E3M999_CLOSL|nr:hypothetical protein [Clostridium scatologenes]AKA69309.1 hypothetical protein CSCA_2184 [Clostridium scatologenes]
MMIKKFIILSKLLQGTLIYSVGGVALINDDTGIISLQYGGRFPINNNISECTDNYYRQMNSKFEEILSLLGSLSFTSFPIGGDVENTENSLRNQTMSLTEFDNSFNAYCNGVRDMEENICSVFSKISGITAGISQIRDTLKAIDLSYNNKMK